MPEQLAATVVDEVNALAGYDHDPADIAAAADDIDAARERVARLFRRPSWMARAACRDLPTDWFFPGKGQSSEPALTVCRECPVITSCRAWALAQPAGEQHGVLAGLSARERVRLIRERGASC